MSSRSSTTASGAAERRRAPARRTAGGPLLTRSGPITFEEFCAIIREDQKADLIDGVIYMASPESTEANDLFGWLFSLMHTYAAEKNLGRVFAERVAFRLGERQGPEPDIAFVRVEHADRIHRGHVVGPPDLAIEIVSPESAERDYVRKRQQYQQAKVPEYWIIDEEMGTVLLLRLDKRGRFREVHPRKGRLSSQVFDGFWLEVNWLWQQPRPRMLQVLQLLLAGSSGP
jgi:Uma2 family endonuclease